ncbi:MAG: DNA-3-methyladenine glycosylase [Polyangia bacterium]
MRLPQSFYARDVRVVARALVGKHLWHGERGGRIVETEAYLGAHDRASHARFGPHGRSKPVFGPPGVSYVFLIYGMHECYNIVADLDGNASAVLIRALEPAEGTLRCDGPGRLTKALGIGRPMNGLRVFDPASPIWVEDRGEASPRITTTPRIGVDYAGAWAKKRYRYVDRDSRALSVRLRP